MLNRFLKNYIERHQNRTNQLFHLVGLPVTFVLPVIFLIQGNGVWALGCFVLGYVLQFIGHAFEGNDAGEMILVKKMLGKPYREFGPGVKDSSAND